MTVMDGASRMSSVRGLNESPQTAMRRPSSEPMASTILSTSRCFWAAFTASTASRIRKR